MFSENFKLRINELKRTLRILVDSPLCVIGFIIILILFVSAIFANFIAPYDPYEIDISNKLIPPNVNHWFGTDDVGRDVFSRVIYGSRYALLSGIIVVSIAVIIGSIVGLLGSYPGGFGGGLIMRITDIFLAFPALVLAIAFVLALGPSFINSMIAISVAYWPKYARLVYGQALSIKENNYVKFAEVLRENNIKIRVRHIFLNIYPVLLVQATLDFGDAILYFAALSFIGLGAQPPAADWGAMVSIAKNYILNGWWMAFFPGLAIFLVVMGFNLLGDSLVDALDPHLRRVKEFKPIKLKWLSGKFWKNILLRCKRL